MFKIHMFHLIRPMKSMNRACKLAPSRFCGLTTMAIMPTMNSLPP
ncbi:hypothetical protein ACHAXS_000087 [Conticribra weissflogii]